MKKKSVFFTASFLALLLLCGCVAQTTSVLSDSSQPEIQSQPLISTTPAPDTSTESMLTTETLELPFDTFDTIPNPPGAPNVENAVELDGYLVPSFLDEQQQLLYLNAAVAYEGMALNPNSFPLKENPTGETGKMMDVNGHPYAQSVGWFTTWAEFETAILAILTPEYFEALNDISYTDAAGVFHERKIFIQAENGDLYYLPGGTGGNAAFKALLGFYEDSRDEEKIVFHVTGECFTDPSKQDIDAETYTKGHPLIMEKNDDGQWRFSLFSFAN